MFLAAVQVFQFLKYEHSVALGELDPWDVSVGDQGVIVALVGVLCLSPCPLLNCCLDAAVDACQAVPSRAGPAENAL